MALSRRKEITEFLVTELKKINGGSSTFDSNYTYSTNIANNVFRRLKFLDEINDFPTICVNAGSEARTYDTSGLITGDLTLNIRAYVRAENPITAAENLADDIEHIVYHLGDKSDIGMLNMIMQSVSTDEGLVAPFGILEIDILARYQLNI